MTKDQPRSAAWMGFDSRDGRLLAGSVTPYGEIERGGYVAIASKPQVAFRGERLFVHAPIASSFLIHGLRVGLREQLVSHGAIPADAFATRMDALAEVDALFARDKVIDVRIGKVAIEVLGALWALPVATIGTEVTIFVENIGDRPLRFVAGLLGGTDDRRDVP